MKISNPSTVSGRSNVFAFSRDLTAASGAVAYTGVGFQPKTGIFVIGVEGTTKVSWGIADEAASEAVVSDNVAALIHTAIPGVLIEIVDTAGVTAQTAVLTSWDADGFTLTWTKTGVPSGTAYGMALCLE